MAKERKKRTGEPVDRWGFTLTDWALLRPEWYESTSPAPPDISGITVPAMTEHWWRAYIQFRTDPQEKDPRRRCAYLIEEGLLPNPFTEDDLIRFSASQIESPNHDTRYAEWNLTHKGYERLAILNGSGGAHEEANTSTASTADASPAKRGKRKPKAATVAGIAAKLDVAAWEAITLEVDEDLVRINGKIDLTYGDMGMGRGAGGGKPNNQRRLLILIAAASQDKPYIPADDSLYSGAKGLDAFSLHLTRLNKALRGSFGLTDNPVYLNDAGAVETLFKITAAGADATDKRGAIHAAKDGASGRRRRVDFETMADAERAADAVREKAKEKSRH